MAKTRSRVRIEGYPRPQLRRAQWTCLDGSWDFALDRQARWLRSEDVKWDATISVPFSPETPASGINDPGFYLSCWYRRTFPTPDLAGGQRLLLHFGAVDYQAEVYLNGKLAVSHEGGYTPFHADVTDLLQPGEDQTLIVRACDDPHDLAKPRGKQDWQLQPHSIWYPRTTGIWQSVWLEQVPRCYIDKLQWTPDVERWNLKFHARLQGHTAENTRLRVRLTADDRILADDTYTVVAREIHREISFSDPGIDDYRNELLWYPHSPRLIQASLELLDADGNTLDQVQSYTAMRGISLLGNRFVLNGKPYPLQLVLDQGYWPETGLTAPDDDAFRRDVELIKSMGFNGVRMHQKIEDPRFLYWADTLGLIVWEEMPSAYRFSSQTVQRLTRQWAEAIDRDTSHPCIAAWVPFNESWGVPELPNSPAQRHCVQALYHLTKTLDPTRPVIGNDGWEAVATDIIAIHDYDADPQRLASRYSHREEDINRLLKHERPGHKVLLLDEFTYENQPIMLTEFGGIAFSPDKNHTWGYSRAPTVGDFAARYATLLETVRSLPLLAGFCYTQFTDTYQEANGLLYMDRTPKFPLDQIDCATRGPQSPRDVQRQAGWRKRIMSQKTLQ